MRILLVEDEQKIRDFVRKGLEDECFSVDSCDDGDEGYRLAQIVEYDAIILDNILPHKTGFEICTLLREKNYSVPIIMLSVQSEVDEKVHALNAGADDYLTKPFSMQELIARIHALLRRPTHLESDILETHNLTLDTKRHEVTKDGEKIILTKKELMLLEYFMKNLGVVLSRSMIMEHVWDMNADPFSNTIESHILSLRRKIGSDKENPIIVTIPGRGYKIE